MNRPQLFSVEVLTELVAGEPPVLVDVEFESDPARFPRRVRVLSGLYMETEVDLPHLIEFSPCDLLRTLWEPELLAAVEAYEEETSEES